ncbi:MAG: acyl-CoA dehydrogenase family protein [Deltaproteobacteria bacterium]|nr:acyl-CoA dehydrogenase family protein [Deltaproteobacteria bacterium]
MNFELSEDQEILRNTVREFCAKEVIPMARQWDEEERFPSEIIPKLAELNLLGMMVSEEYGGAGMSLVDYVLVIEELARADGSVCLTVASHNSLCTAHINLAGTPAQKKKYLPRLARGEILGAWGLTEPGSGSDAAAARTTAVKRGDRWILNGQKTFITQGSVGGVCVIMASTSPEKRQRGLTAFIVDKGTKGFRASRKIEKMGLHASDTAELVLEDVEVGDEQRLGDVDAGFRDTLRILERGRIGVASMAVGLGRGALEEATKYSKERIQFDVPLAKHQAIQFMLADMATELDAARLLTWRAAWLQDQGQRTPLEASHAKLWAAQVAMRACDKAIQIHGGYGYTREFPVERYLRDAKLCEIGEGTNEVQRMLIARHLSAQGLP